MKHPPHPPHPPSSHPQCRPPFERMVRIHDALTAGGYPNATSLARALEVSPKTILRDLHFMRDRLGLPIAYDDQQFGYRYTEKVDAFPALQISEGELFAFLVAEKALQQYRGSPFEKRLVGAFRKLTQSLPDTISFNLGEWDRTISFRTRAEPVFDPSIIESIAQAAARGQ
ncbi:MAG: helix-turn-helix transcriptional regulator, partial [Verrucomicrobiota bacterium]